MRPGLAGATSRPLPWPSETRIFFLVACALVGWGRGAAAAARPSPLVTCPVDGRCSLSRLPPVLADPEILGHLRSGLTSTLVFTLSATRPRRAQASAGVEVRFEPWEEVFHVTQPSRTEGPQRSKLASTDDLKKWWAGLVIPLDLSLPAGTPAEVELNVVPFSEADEADARRWYAEALRRGDPRPTRGLGDVLDAVTLTSIKRRGVVRISWTATVADHP